MTANLKTYKTTNLFLAASLKLHGFKLIDFEQANPGKIIFVFEDRPERQDIVRRFFSNELQGPLRGYGEEWKNLRTMITEMGDHKGR